MRPHSCVRKIRKPAKRLSYPAVGLLYEARSAACEVTVLLTYSTRILIAFALTFARRCGRIYSREGQSELPKSIRGGPGDVHGAGPRVRGVSSPAIGASYCSPRRRILCR